MTQYAYPMADTYRGSYVDQADGASNVYQAIDEATPGSDTDYIKSTTNPVSEPYVCKLQSITDPVVHTGHSVNYRYSKDISSGGEQIDLVVQLRQGYVNEGTPGTLIASNTHTNIPASWTAGSISLSSGEAGNITDYSSLYVRFVFNKP